MFNTATFKQFLARRGASALTYGLLIGLISVAALLSVSGIGGSVVSLFDRTAVVLGQGISTGEDAESTPETGPAWQTAVDLGSVAEGEAFGPLVVEATGTGLVTYSLISPPASLSGLSFDAGTATLSGTADEVSGDQLVTITIEATDQTGSVSRDFLVTITDITAPTDGLIAAFLFDGSLNGATAFDNAPTFVSGVVGQAVSFDGVDDITGSADNDFATGDGTTGPWGSTGTFDYRGDYFSLGGGNQYDFETFSMSFWVNLPLTNTAEFMSKRPNCGTGTQFGLRYGVFAGQTSIKIEFDNLARSPSNVSPDPRLPITASTWHHIVFSRTDPGSGNATVDGWVDGVQVVSGQQVVGGVIENPTDLVFGLSPCAPATGYGAIGMTVGSFDQLRIYDRALTQADVDRLYKNGQGT